MNDEETVLRTIMAAIFLGANLKRDGVESLYPILGEKRSKDFAEHLSKFEKSVELDKHHEI